jgi:hypothetical protein
LAVADNRGQNSLSRRLNELADDAELIRGYSN